ncbi:MAG: DUF3465 domain-containing protein [Betaproteobacteria bacterium]|nr:DUF3465 domain-containing protein [Betaproteobacteria bacterium]
MNKFLLIAALAGAAYLAFPGPGTPGGPERSSHADAPLQAAGGSDAVLENAFAQRLHGQQVTGRGTVAKVLRDDVDGSRHQRFIVRLDSGRTVLVAHNIDLAPRVDALRVGEPVAFHGEYEWNPKGGVIHWTHRDPRGRHPAGWIRHDGQTYQ